MNLMYFLLYKYSALSIVAHTFEQYSHTSPSMKFPCSYEDHNDST